MAYLDLTGLGYFKDKLIDPTLSVAGKAAEDKAVGDAVADFLPTDTSSGAIASFPDGADGVPVKALTVDIEPVQDLHGQSAPYPAGGGKNILAPTFYNGIGYNVAVGTVLTLTEATNVSVSGNTYTRTVGEWGGFGMCSPQLATGTYYLMAELTSVNMRSSIYVLNSDMSVSRNLGNIGSGTTRSIGTVITLSGDEAYIAFNCLTSSAGNVSISTPMVALSSSATSFAPYSNICPITGHTAVELWRAGTNIFDESVFADLGAVLQEDGTYYFQTALAFLNKVIWTNDSGYTGALNIAIKYRYSSASSSGVRPIVHYTDGTSIQLYMPATTTESTYTYTTNSAKSVSKITLTYGSGSIDTWWNFAMSPQSLTTYEPYTATHISIPLGQTIYGGTLDVLNGVLTVDRAMVDMGDLSWSVWNEVFYADVSGKQNRTQANDVISTAYAPSSRNATGASDARQFMSDFSVCGFYSTTSTSSYVYVKDSRYTLADNFKPAVTGQKIVYALATPITIDLTDIPTISTLLGQNNVWSDSGDVSVEYRADIQKYITKVIAEAIS